jgi:hypothetical protein
MVDRNNSLYILTSDLTSVGCSQISVIANPGYYEQNWLGPCSSLLPSLTVNIFIYLKQTKKALYIIKTFQRIVQRIAAVVSPAQVGEEGASITI